MIFNDKQRRISAREVERSRVALEAAKTRDGPVLAAGGRSGRTSERSRTH